MVKQSIVFVAILVCSTLLGLFTLPVSSIRQSVLLQLADHESNKYAVIFDAGSTGSRVHVFSFDKNMDLVPFGDEFELYVAVKPGLSSYADDTEAAAQSLKPLLERAIAVIPEESRSQTPVRLGATAGLRLLNGDAPEKILEAVRELLKMESGLKYKAEWVSILDGFQEGSYMWVAVNYLLENLGKKYSSTVAVVDLGGGSVQMAYAISKEGAENAPKSSSVEDQYVQERDLKGEKYYLYAHSYLNYGLNAARAELLKLSGNKSNPCIVNGYQGTYSYSGVTYNVSPPQSGTSLRKCRMVARKALNLNAPCSHMNCTFNGAWNGGGGAGQRNLYIASYFYDTASAANIVEQGKTSLKLTPTVYRDAAKTACATNAADIKSKFPYIEDRDVPFLCMDLLYEYTLLVDGFGISPLKKVTVAQKINYKNSLFGAAWPLGCGVDVLSSLSSSPSSLPLK